jgi:O-antigen/teichoic acid export membrane protein
MPILARLYAPSDFGVASMFLAAASILSVVITGRYELAINLPRQEEKATALAALALCLSIAAGLLLLVPIHFLNADIALMMGDPMIGPWLYLMPLAVVTCAVFNVVQMWNSRQMDFKEMGLGYARPSILSGVLNIGLGLGKVPQGMIVGSLAAQVLSIFLSARKIFQGYRREDFMSTIRKTPAVAREYIRFPVVLVPAHVIGAVSQQIPLFLMGALYQAGNAGYFSIVNRLFVLPAAVVGAPLGEVLRAQAARLHTNGQDIKRIFLIVLVGALTAGGVIFLGLNYSLPFVVNIMLGPDWQPVVEMGRILLIPAYFQFVAASVDKVFLTLGSTRYELIVQIARATCLLPLVGLAGLNVEIGVMVEWISYSWSVFYVLVVMMSVHVVFLDSRRQPAE